MNSRKSILLLDIEFSYRCTSARSANLAHRRNLRAHIGLSTMESFRP